MNMHTLDFFPNSKRDTKLRLAATLPSTAEGCPWDVHERCSRNLPDLGAVRERRPMKLATITWTEKLDKYQRKPSLSRQRLARTLFSLNCVLCLSGSAQRSGSIIGEGRSALQTAAKTTIGGGGGGGGDLHQSASFRTLQPERAYPDKAQKPYDMAWPRFPNTTFLGILFPIWHFSLVCYDEKDEEDGARAGEIGLIRQGLARVGLEADQPDRDWVSSDR